MTLCGECAQKHQAWYDYRLPRSIRLANHSAYDDTRAGIRDNRRGRFENWRNTVTSQQELIRRICERKHQKDGQEVLQ